MAMASSYPPRACRYRRVSTLSTRARAGCLQRRCRAHRTLDHGPCGWNRGRPGQIDIQRRVFAHVVSVTRHSRTKYGSDRNPPCILRMPRWSHYCHPPALDVQLLRPRGGPRRCRLIWLPSEPKSITALPGLAIATPLQNARGDQAPELNRRPASEAFPGDPAAAIELPVMQQPFGGIARSAHSQYWVATRCPASS